MNLSNTSINLIKKLLFYNKIKTHIRINRIRGKTKIFCIGYNKTGTTSLGKALYELGIIIAPQKPAEILINDWGDDEYKNIIKFCKEYQCFQDVPFSLTDSYKYLDKAFPNSKFILTVRDTPDQWYNSIRNFHSKLFGTGGHPPTKEDLLTANYVYSGWMWDFMKIGYGVLDGDVYNKTLLVNSYNLHNESAKDYFKGKSNQYIEINLSERESYKRLCDFLNIQSVKTEFPSVNKTSE